MGSLALSLSPLLLQGEQEDGDSGRQEEGVSLLEALEDAPDGEPVGRKRRPPPGPERTSLWSTIVFMWVQPLLVEGGKRQLDLDDLFEVRKRANHAAQAQPRELSPRV